VIRVEETTNVADKEVDLGKVRKGETLPADLVGEPQMVLIEGDVVQISAQRDDGWTFGTKLHHADEAAARQLVMAVTGQLSVATTDESDESSTDDEANVFTDTGWFQMEATRIPTSDDLAALRKTVGSVDAGSLDPPSCWDPVQDATVAQKHELKEGHPERDAVVKSFMSTLGKGTKVLKVERIQNLAMYQSYVVKRSVSLSFLECLLQISIPVLSHQTPFSLDDLLP